MKGVIGIRREDKNQWERRTPLVPKDVKELIERHGLTVAVQPSPNRVFAEAEYRQQGAEIREDLSDCQVIFGVKEIPLAAFMPGHGYMFFSHTIKGQSYNMPMLKHMLASGCHLIDYERVTDERGRRLLFFGNFAGLAGMIDSLWAFGKKLAAAGIRNPFEAVKQAYAYPDLKTAQDDLRQVGEVIRREGLPAAVTPLICGFSGYGNVSQGAQQIYDLLPVTAIDPHELVEVERTYGGSHEVFKVVFKEEHMAARIDGSRPFELQEYYQHPERYRSQFEAYLPHLSILMNCIYWTTAYPRLVTNDYLRKLFRAPTPPRLQVIGDISCDVEGAVEATSKATTPGDPVYTYNPLDGTTADGWTGDGVTIMAVENLPCELPREASEFFSQALKSYVTELARADFTAALEQCGLTAEIRHAVIAYQGRLTPAYEYIANLW